MESLAKIYDDIFIDSPQNAMEELVRKLNIASGPDESLLPKNIGLLFFNPNQENFFYKSNIEIVRFSDNDGADDFIEKVFTGALHKQIEKALEYINSNVIHEKVKKVDGQAEALRFYNFPFSAIEEALVNAVYHRSYQEQQPVEVRIYPNRIHILNYPGPLPPISNDSMSKGKFNARRYRNPRMGDFLKELGLAETRGTGVPKINRTMSRNGSPDVIFETDDDRTYFEVTLPIHEFFDKEDLKIEDDKFDAEFLFSLGLNKRQVLAVEFVQKKGYITNSTYQEICNASERTASRDLKNLTELEVFKKVGNKKGTKYEMLLN